MLKKKKNDIFYYYLSFKKIFQTLKSLSFSWSLEESALQASWPGSSFPTQNLGDFSHQLTFWALAVVVVQWLSHVWLFVTPWTATHQAPPSSTISWSLLRFMSIEWVMLSDHLTLCDLLLWPSTFPSTSSVQSLSCVRFFATPWIAAGQAGLPVHHQLPEFTQTHVHRVGDATQPSHPLSSPSPPTPNPSQHQGLFQWVNSSHQVAKVLEFQLQHQSFQWTPRTDL